MATDWYFDVTVLIIGAEVDRDGVDFIYSLSPTQSTHVPIDFKMRLEPVTSKHVRATFWANPLVMPLLTDERFHPLSLDCIREAQAKFPDPINGYVKVFVDIIDRDTGDVIADYTAYNVPDLPNISHVAAALYFSEFVLRTNYPVHSITYDVRTEPQPEFVHNPIDIDDDDIPF